MSEEKVKERPIPFSAPMVLAILECRKTQTRRIVKPQPGPSATMFAWEDSGTWRANGLICDVKMGPWTCPYGFVGERLWVRETWAPRIENDKPYEVQRYVKYRADCEDGESPSDIDDWHHWEDKWRPSIFMPRWASRITLEITEVRAHRLHEISREDARDEGIPETTGNHEYDNRTTVENFAVLWNKINGTGSWEANPWVWAITFERVT